MDLSTALTIILFFYAVIMIALGIEYFTDKLRKKKAPPQKRASETQQPQEAKKVRQTATEQLEKKEETEKEEPGDDEPIIVDLEAEGKEEGKEEVKPPKIWKEEEFE